MTQPAIRVVDLGKEYHIGLRRSSNRTLRETIVDVVKVRFVEPRNYCAKGQQGPLSMVPFTGPSETCHLRFRTAT
jgi:hypothetical protein